MIDLWNNVDFFCDFQQILTFLTPQFLTLLYEHLFEKNPLNIYFPVIWDT